MVRICVLLSILIFFFSYESSESCKCAEFSNIVEALKYSDYVFVGIILNEEKVVLNDSTLFKKLKKKSKNVKDYEWSQEITRFNCAVSQILEGKVLNDTVIIYTGNGQGDCGVIFEIGKKYIIFANKDTYFPKENSKFVYPEGVNIFWTLLCSGTQKYNSNDLNSLINELQNK